MTRYLHTLVLSADYKITIKICLIWYPCRNVSVHSDVSIANVWKRLELGSHTRYDLQLLRHEAAEAWFMRKYGPSYTTAHNAANKKFPASDLEKINVTKSAKNNKTQ